MLKQRGHKLFWQLRHAIYCMCLLTKVFKKNKIKLVSIATATLHNSKAKGTWIYQDRTAEVPRVLLVLVL